MAEFFNKKEEVLDIQLTQHGKHLLSKGKFDPEYYAFFDDDILYDASYAGVSEEQNEAQVRIFEAPRMKAQYLYYGAETKVNQVNQIIRSNFEDTDIAEKIQNSPEKSIVMQYPLGNSDLNQVNSPAWDLKTYGTPVSSSADYVSSSSGFINHISQIDLDYVIRTAVGYDGDIGLDEYNFSLKIKPGAGADIGQEGLDEAYTGTRYLTLDEDEGSPEVDNMSEVFEDGSYIQLVEKDFVLLDLKEENTDDLLQNFEVEVFRIETGKNGEEVLQPLTFAKKTEDPINLFDTDETLEDYFAVQTLTPKNVEWFFDILLDGEVDPSVACGSLNAEQVSTMFENSDLNVDCTQLQTDNQFNAARDTYGDIPSGQDEEPCD